MAVVAAPQLLEPPVVADLAGESRADIYGELYRIASDNVAVSAALYVAAQAVDPDLIQSWGLFIGRQDNVALRFGGAIGLLFNVFMVVVAIASIILTVPSKRPPREEEARPDEVAPPAFGN